MEVGSVFCQVEGATNYSSPCSEETEEIVMYLPH
jgi:hypothetical protein